MQKRSYGSVEVTWLDRPAVLRAVHRAVRALVSRRPEVLRVVLFGSMAHLLPGRHPRWVDVFAYTEVELARMQAEGNPFLRQALAEGVTLFHRREAPSKAARR